MADYSVRKGITQIEDYAVETVAADIILNANENNFPMPEAVAAAINAKTASFPFNRYPPVKAEMLSEAIAEELELDSDCIRIGNGSAELLRMACYVFGGPGKKIAVPFPSISLYGKLAALSDSDVLQYPLNEDGYLDADTLLDFYEQEHPDVIVICNPHNPTGNYNPLYVVEKIISNIECPILVDEAYMEFADGSEVPPGDMRPLQKLWLVAGSALCLLPKYSNLIVFRSFSKAYGLAGLRCGYAAGTVGIIRQLGKALLPYQVNAYTLMIAKTVYDNKQLYKEQLKLVRQERARVIEYLEKLGFMVYQSRANFICCKATGDIKIKLSEKYCEEYEANLSEDEAAGKLLFRYLLENGILVSDFTSMPSLDGCLRITIGTPEENSVLLTKITELVVGL